MLNKENRPTQRVPQGFRHHQKGEATLNANLNIKDEPNHILRPNGKVSTCVKSKEKV